MSNSLNLKLISSWMTLVAIVLTVLTFQNTALAQTRGFPNTEPVSTLAIDTVLGNWQALQNDLRTTIGKKRSPQFEFRILAREIPGGNSVEKFAPNQLPHRIVLVIGGLQSSIVSTERFATALSTALHDPMDTRVAVFGYPNDGSIRESASGLREMLNDLHRQSPATKVSIVAHSMGCLVARHAIEPTARETGCQVKCVDQLIMLCPPNHGSVLAQYGDALEVPDAMSKLRGRSLSFTEVIQSLINDGLGEACEELVPNSPFLQELNSRPRAEGVRYSIIGGTGGPITPLLRFASSVGIKETRERTRVNQLPNAKDVLNRFDELLISDEFAQGFGDGAVSLQSATLPGVREFYTVPMNHAQWAQIDKPQVQQLVQKTAELLRGQQPIVGPATPHRAKF